MNHFEGVARKPAAFIPTAPSAAARNWSRAGDVYRIARKTGSRARASSEGPAASAVAAGSLPAAAASAARRLGREARATVSADSGPRARKSRRESGVMKRSVGRGWVAGKVNTLPPHGKPGAGCDGSRVVGRGDILSGSSRYI